MKYVTYVFFFLITLAALSLSFGCGSSNSSSSANGDSASPLASPNSGTTTVRIFAHEGFQSTGIQVNSGDSLLFSSAGSWSGGEVDGNLAPLTCGASGCNGYEYVNGLFGPAQGFDQLNCGAPDGSVLKYQATNQGTNVGPSYSYTVLSGNYGLCCSQSTRVIDQMFGIPHTIVQPNECAPGARNALVLKILGPGDDEINITPVLIGTNYTSSAYTVPIGGTVYLTSNNYAAARGASSGYLDVTISRN